MEVIEIFDEEFFKYSDNYISLTSVLEEVIDDKTLFICIGTDRCIPDCLGPLVGTFLKEKNFPLPVYGTVYDPIHALNIEDRYAELKILYKNYKIIAIDACLGNIESLGDIKIKNVPISPGKALSKNLPKIGDYSIVGFVGELGDKDIFRFSNKRLSFVYNMAKLITASIIDSYNTSKKIFD